VGPAVQGGAPVTRHGHHRKTAGVGGPGTGTNPRLINLFACLQPVTALEPAAAPEDLTWQDDALCAQVDPEIFFPEKGGSTREPKRVCRACEVRAECLEYALEHQERFGIWGGFSERERRRLKRAPTAAPPNPQSREAA
jgi:WhiB family transcriptional regulator, redox-sensing transcriptional regulator